MKKLLASITIIGFLFLLWGCPGGIHKKYNYDAYFPTAPVNLSVVNSEYDDYNSILPEYHFGKQLIFSSNRNSEGSEFSLVHDHFNVTWYMETSELVVNNDDLMESEHYITEMISRINWEGNEFGPYAIGFDTMIGDEYTRMNLLAYATNNDKSTYHEEFVYHVTTDGGTTGTAYGPFTIPFLNDNPRQQYISFYGPDVLTIDQWELNPNLFTSVYFDADENGQADIYKIDIPNEKNFMQFLTDTAIYQRQKIEELSTSSDDRCPFINGNFMVFASNRPGGYGGYDLYYSKFDGQSWSEPVNFGEDINTEYDEFRPVAMQVFDFKNDVMLFSSDRPGGKGGFDLYYVGIDKITPHPVIE